MPATAPPTLADRFTWLVESLLQVVFRHMGGPLVGPICGRVRRLGREFASVIAQLQAGTLPRLAIPSGVAGGNLGQVSPAPGAARDERPRPPSLLPRQFGWLYRLLGPVVAPPTAGTLSALVHDPAMAELVAAAPQLGGTLRPFCHMLGLKPPGWLALPRRPRVRKDPSPHPSPTRGEGEEKRRGRPSTPREQAEAAVRRALATGIPIDPRKLSAVAYGYVLHTPRNDSCPPVELGYGRGRWPPRDYEGRFKNED